MDQRGIKVAKVAIVREWFETVRRSQRSALPDTLIATLLTKLEEREALDARTAWATLSDERLDALELAPSQFFVEDFRRDSSKTVHELLELLRGYRARRF